MSSISFERAAGYYDATRGYTPEVQGWIADAIVAAAGATSRSRFLEVGIGTGRIAFPLIARGYAYAGIDISPSMMDQLRRKLAVYAASHPDPPPLRADLREGDATALPYPDAQFDVVLTVHVLHLIPNWREVITEMLRILKPGGVCLTCGEDRLLPNVSTDTQDRWLAILHQLGYHDTGQTTHTMRDTLIQEFEQRGLHPEILRPVSWEVEATPLQALHYLKERKWSRTWRVPDDLFAESIRLLEVEVQQRYGARLDMLERQRLQFTIARVRKPA